MHCVAFLRAINVGGRRVTNDQLTAAVSAAGFSQVVPFLASGNVMFHAAEVAPEDAEPRIEAAITTGLGFRSEAFVRTAGELEALIAAVPFDAQTIDGSTAKPQIGFLRRPLAADVRQQIDALTTDTDLLRVIGRELHWLPLAGVSGSAVDPGVLDRLLGPVTVRSLTTVVRLATKLKA